MKINIDIDGYLVERMHDKYCLEHGDCSSCPSQPTLNDNEVGCFGKYKNKIFVVEFKEVIDKIVDVMYKV